MSSLRDLLAVEATPNSATTLGNTAGECITLPATLMTPSLQTPPPLPGMLVHGLGPDGGTGPRGSDWTTSSPSSGLIAPTWIQATNNDKTSRVLNRFFLLENAIPFCFGKKITRVYCHCLLARVLRRIIRGGESWYGELDENCEGGSGFIAIYWAVFPHVYSMGAVWLQP